MALGDATGDLGTLGERRQSRGEGFSVMEGDDVPTTGAPLRALTLPRLGVGAFMGVLTFPRGEEAAACNSAEEATTRSWLPSLLSREIGLIAMAPRALVRDGERAPGET